MKNARNYLVEAKTYKLTESVIPHQTLFQHQLGHVRFTIYNEKLFTQNVTNITFVFEASPNAKPKEKKVGRHGILCPHPSEKVGGHVPRVPHQIASMCAIDLVNFSFTYFCPGP